MKRVFNLSKYVFLTFI